MPDVFALLSDDHRTVDGLFEQYQQSSDPAVAVAICDELTIHAMLEEELIYPVLATKAGPGLATEARREHEEAKQLITQIEAGIGQGSDVSALVTQLQASVQHHVQEEESQIFPRMREKVPSLVEAMGTEAVNRKQVLKEQMADARSLGQQSDVVARKLTEY